MVQSRDGDTDGKVDAGRADDEERDGPAQSATDVLPALFHDEVPP
jgi:hypothetical protein